MILHFLESLSDTMTSKSSLASTLVGSIFQMGASSSNCDRHVELLVYSNCGALL